jgi:hypothetical protein
MSKKTKPAVYLHGSLRAARWLHKRAGHFTPRPGFAAASRQRLLARIRLSTVAPRRFAWLPDFAPGWKKLATQIVLAILLFSTGFLTADSLSAASQTWLPGDPPYPLKVTQERFSLALAVTPARRTSLHIEFARRRMFEAQALVFEGRYEQIPAAVDAFAGHIESALADLSDSVKVDVDQSQALTVRLEQTLSGQVGLVELLADITPSPHRQQLLRLLQVAESGLAELHALSPSGSS